MRDHRDAKSMAKSLRKDLKAKGLSISHGECLNIVARQFGLADWNELKPAIDATEMEPPQFSGPLRPCKCRALERAARDPGIPVAFDERLCEYSIPYQSGPMTGSMLIRYCFSCGGRPPPSNRASLFELIDHAETQRLNTLLRDIKTVAEVEAAFGPPDSVHAMTMTSNPPRDEAPETTVRREFVYRNMSDVADVRFRVSSDDHVTPAYVAKPRRAE